MWKKVKLLENHAHLAAYISGSSIIHILAILHQILTLNSNRTAINSFESVKTTQQCAFTRTGRTKNSNYFTLL